MTSGTVTCVPIGGQAGAHSFSQGTANTPPNNSVGFQAPTSVPTAYLVTMPSAPAAGYVKRTNANPSVESVGAIAGADLPNPSASTLGGVKSLDCTGTGHILKIGTDGTPTCSADAGGGASAFTAAPFFPWGIGYSDTTGLFPNANGTPANITSFGFNVQAAMSFSHFSLSITTAATSNCGGGSSPCGLAVSIKNPARSSDVCVATTAFGGGTPDINSTGVKNLTFASGSGVTGGVCTLTPGRYFLVANSESAALKWMTYSTSNVTPLINNLNLANCGYATSVTPTGSGSLRAIPADISAATFYTFGTYPYIALDGN